MKEKTKMAEPANLVEEEEEEYPLVYNLWIENMTINMAEGSTIFINSGKPKDGPP